MEFEPSDEIDRQTRLVRVGQYIKNILHSAKEGLRLTKEQLAMSDPNIGEGEALRTITPMRYLLQAPDFLPAHDDTIISESE